MDASIDKDFIKAMDQGREKTIEYIIAAKKAIVLPQQLLDDCKGNWLKINRMEHVEEKVKNFVIAA